MEIVERTVVPPQKSAPPKTPQHGEWVDLIRELARQLDRGTLYDRDLPTIAPALDEAISAFKRRARGR